MRPYEELYAEEIEDDGVDLLPSEQVTVPIDPKWYWRPARTFSWLAILTPRRIWNEDVGDALETIEAMRRAKCSKLQVQAKIISTYFWVLIAAIRELIAALTGRKSPHK